MTGRRWQELVAGARRREFVVGSALFLLALLPRLYQLDVAPPGLNGDEVYNIIDARSIGWGNLPVYFPGNQGREALYFYLLALSLRLFGTTVWTLRLPSVLLGSGSVLLAYLVGRDMFGRRVGLVAAVLIAVSLWPIMLSRTGLRPISLTFLTTLAVYFLFQALQGGRLRHWLPGGAALGLALYTYIPGRVFPLVIAGWLVWIAWRRREQLRLNIRSLVLSLALAGIVFAPFGFYMARHPETVNQRIASMTNALERARAGEPQALLASVGGVLKMFSIAGDEEWRYHLAHQPVFDPLTSVFFYVGLAFTCVGAFRARDSESRQPEYALLLFWAAAMLAPNAVLNENPSFLRAAGAIVPVYMMTGIGVQHVFMWVQRRVAAPRWAGPLLIALGLAATLIGALQGYFGVWTNHPQVRSIYHADQALMGRYLESHSLPPDTRVFVAYDYVYDLPTALSLSLFTDQHVAWFSRENTFVWPADDPDGFEAWYLVPAVQQFPPDVLRQLQEHAEQETVRFAGGDEAFTIYRLTDVGASTPAPDNHLDLSFEDGPRLIGYDVPRFVVGGEDVVIRLHWQVAEDASSRVNRLTYVQLHLADATGVVRSRSEALLGYPQAGWISGDHFVQDVTVETPSGMLPGPAALAFGLRDDQGLPIGAMSTAAESTPLLVRSRPLSDFSVTPEMTVYDDVLALVGAGFRPLVTPGADLNVELNWVVLQQPEQAYRVQLQLVGGENRTAILTQTFELWPDVYPPTRWQPLEEVTTLHGFRIPVSLAEEAAVTDGSLALQVLLLPAAGNGDEARPISGGSTRLGTLDLDMRQRIYELPAPTFRTDAQFGEAFRLLGYELDTSAAHPGGAVQLALAWQAIRTPDKNYTVFNHLVGADGQLVGQFDSPPVGDAWLTRTWLPGEIVVEQREIPIEANATPGEVQLVVGLYDPHSLQRLPVRLEGQIQAGDQLLLHTFALSGQAAGSR